MKEIFNHLDLPDKEKFFEWLEGQAKLMDLSPQGSMAVVLYKLYQMEKTLETIDYKVTTHWAK